MRNIFSADNLYQAGLNLFAPRAQAKKQKAVLDQQALTSQINKRQEPIRLQRAGMQPTARNVFAQPNKTVVSGTRSTPFYSDISATAKKYGINPKFLDSLVFAESSYNPAAMSKSGAYGLTQIMPSTLRELGYTGQPQALTPQQQLDYGAQYLKKIYDVRQRNLGVSRPLTPLEWYHAYSFGANTKQPISPQYQSNWERAYGRY